MSKQGNRFLQPGRGLAGSMDKLIRPLETFSIHPVAKVTKNHVLKGIKVSLSKSCHFESAQSLTYWFPRWKNRGREGTMSYSQASKILAADTEGGHGHTGRECLRWNDSASAARLGPVKY